MAAVSGLRDRVIGKAPIVVREPRQVVQIVSGSVSLVGLRVLLKGTSRDHTPNIRIGYDGGLIMVFRYRYGNCDNVELRDRDYQKILSAWKAAGK